MPDLPDKKSEPAFKDAIYKGVLLGIGLSALTILAYIIDYTILVHGLFYLVVMVYLAIGVSYFGIQHRKSAGGYLSFGKSYRFAFLALTTSLGIQLLFNILLYSIIDPELSDLQTGVITENAKGLFRLFGMNQDQIDAMIIGLKKEISTQFEPLSQLKSSWVMILTSLFSSLLLGLLIKKTKSVN